MTDDEKKMFDVLLEQIKRDGEVIHKLTEGYITLVTKCQEAALIAEAVKWCESNATHVEYEVGEIGNERDRTVVYAEWRVYKDEVKADRDTLPETVASLQRKLAEKEASDAEKK